MPTQVGDLARLMPEGTLSPTPSAAFQANAFQFDSFQEDASPVGSLLPVGVWIDWDNNTFATGALDNITSDVISFTWNRGGTPDLVGGVQPGQATIVVKNADGKYTPDNASSALFGKLRTGHPVWIGANGDGTLSGAGTVYGVFAGLVREIVPLPSEGIVPTAEIICEDPLGWYSRQPVALADDTTRSQYSFRVAVLDALGEAAGRRDLDEELATLPLSSADSTDALATLTSLNAANGTRHFAKPDANRDVWYKYTTRNRMYGVGKPVDFSLTGVQTTQMSGYRVTDDTIINRQRAVVGPVSFPSQIGDVWTYAECPFTVNGNRTIYATFPDYVQGAAVVVTYTGALASSVTSFGTTARIDMFSFGGAQVTSLRITGRQVVRGQDVTVVANDTSSQASYGIRMGGDIAATLSGTGPAAQGLADNIVWRFAQPLKRPAITLRDQLPVMLAHDLYEQLALTTTALSVVGRRFEIVGISGTCTLAASASTRDWSVTWQLQESRLQADQTFFILNTSTLNGSDLLGY